MSNRLKITLAPGMRLRFPRTGIPLEPDVEYDVVPSLYWRRRLADGGVLEVKATTTKGRKGGKKS